MKNKQIPLFKALLLGTMMLYIDFFCGWGGATEGIRRAEANAKVIACVNHDEMAIQLHAVNHPDCDHLQEDITDVDTVVLKLKKIVEIWKKKYPKAFICFWLSPDCTSHTGAKGGQSRNPDSRCLADFIPTYTEAINPSYLQLENVKEFLKWGPTRLREGISSCENYSVLAKGRKDPYIIVPDKKYDTLYYRIWRDKMMLLGYKYDYKLFNVADFGLRTSRLRYWGLFAKCGLPMKWPEKTHDKLGRNGLKKWEPARPFLDLHIKGDSIFCKPRAYNTWVRFFKGLKDNVGKLHFMTGYYGNGRHHSIENPINTLTTKDRYALHYIQYQYGNSHTTSINEPVGTMTCNPKHEIMTLEWIMDFQYSRTSHSVDDPMYTMIARQDKLPIYVLQAELGYPENFISDDDIPIVRQIKEFMILHLIKDVTIRMLSVPEQLRLQSFGDQYFVMGATDTQAKKFIGNSVPPDMAKILVESLFSALNAPEYSDVIYINKKSKRKYKNAA
ncbi:DNA cytosine methyltransferase [Flavobacterium sp.]|uniref:DNA cytosine methyltransferase n=1 Tax=Flavobacterium sp. TaxID=239 RepID=UPI003D6A5A7C